MNLKNKLAFAIVGSVFLASASAMIIVSCSSSSTDSSSTSSSTSRTLTAYTTASSTAVTTAYGGTCTVQTRDTSSCQSARTTLGLSGEWLKFSCNVVLGLADSSGNSTTSTSNASYVTVAFVDLPDYTSNYYPSTSGTSYSFTANSYTVTGTFESLYSAYTTTFPDPSSIAQQSVTMNIPLNPTAATSKSQTMGMGMVGVAVNGIAIYSNLASGTDNIFAEAGSFDQCQGHPSSGNGGTYHYHSEPYSISYNDDSLIGVMRDGFFIYGRKDSDGSTPGSVSNVLNTGDSAGTGTSSNLYIYGGHIGVPPSGGSSIFHYHLTEWIGCMDETKGSGGYTKKSDDGETQDSYNSPTVTTCDSSTSDASQSSSGIGWTDTWFMTGHGNGGAFQKGGSGSTGAGNGVSGWANQSPSQSTNGIRYYYGTAGTCTGC